MKQKKLLISKEQFNTTSKTIFAKSNYNFKKPLLYLIGKLSRQAFNPISEKIHFSTLLKN